MNLTEAFITSRSWIFRSAGGIVFSPAIKFASGGKILNYDQPHEKSWQIIDGYMCFLNARGLITTRFSCVDDREDGTIILSGRFRLEISKNFFFVLEEVAMSARELMARFESIGDNCEFGLVQRFFGFESLGLFRFNWTDYAHLLRGLDCNFEDLGVPGDVKLELAPNKEFIVKVPKYKFTYHTDRFEGQVKSEALLKTEIARINILKRKFLEDVAEGEKILVRKSNKAVSRPEMLQLYAKLRRLGPTTLLWVCAAHDDARVGEVDVVEDSLLIGYVDRFAPYERAFEISFNAWAKICRSAAKLVLPER